MLTCRRTEKGWEVTATEKDFTIASLQLEAEDVYLYVHNTVNLWTPRTRRLYKKILEFIKIGAKAAGYKFIITGDAFTPMLPKQEKYWRIMGFNLFGETECYGRPIRCAGMEL